MTIIFSDGFESYGGAENDIGHLPDCPAALTPRGPFMTTWEYKALRTEAHPNDLFFAISQAGKEGWELVGTIGLRAYMKRPVHSLDLSDMTTPTGGAGG